MILLHTLLLAQSTVLQPLPAPASAGPQQRPAAAVTAIRPGALGGRQALAPPTTSAVRAGAQAGATSSPYEDCNANGIPDGLELASGAVADCQMDGVPDVCQLEVPFRYVHGDGIINGSVGGSTRHCAWVTRYIVQPGQEIVTDIELGYGDMPTGTAHTIGLWLDPDGDGEPSDAQPIMSQVVFAQFPQTAIVVKEDVPDTYIGPAGTSFFVGGYGEFDPAPINYPAGLDVDSLVRESWWITSDTPIDPADLAGGAVVDYGPIGQFIPPFDGDWGFRLVCCAGGHCGESSDIDANGIPDECEDCNGNSIPDGLDILNGGATDCDGNQVPDECESLTDCDANGLPDLCQSLNPQGLVGQYYANKTLQGAPLVRIDPDVFFDFGADPPFPGLLSSSNFSARWTGGIRTGGATGTYTFGVEHSRGIRLWVNGVSVIDDWWDGTGFDTGTVDLDANTSYYIELEYFSEGNGRCELSWQEPGGSMTPVLPGSLTPFLDGNQDGVLDPCQITDCNANGVADQVDLALGTADDCDLDGIPDACQPCDDADGNGLLDSCELTAGPGLHGQYYRTLGGNPPAIGSLVLQRIDPNIDFDWATGAPAPGMPTDEFLVRWTGSLLAGATGGTYLLHVQADDGVRLWLGGDLLVDEWHLSSGNEYTVSVPLAAGSRHSLRLDYYEAGGDARIFLRWTEPGGVKVPIPPSAFLVSSDVDGDGVPDLATDDCDRDGVPDALEADLNGNCIPDSCEDGNGYWRFEEASGSQVQDASGFGNDGTLNALPTRITDVAINPIPRNGLTNTQSLDLGWQGITSGGRVTVPDGAGLLVGGPSDFTLEAWVRLDDLASTDGTGNYPPDDRQWLFMKKPQASSDALLDYALLVQGADLTFPGAGSAGRRMLFRFGTGSTVTQVGSSLEINDADWHFVSLAYDHSLQQVRFGLDGIFQMATLTEPRTGLASSTGPLLIGAHENQAATKNQFLRGAVDEARFTPAYLPPELLLDRAP